MRIHGECRNPFFSNKEVEHEDLDCLAASVEEVFKDRVKEAEEGISALGRTANGLKLSPRQTADPWPHGRAYSWTVRVPQPEIPWPWPTATN